MYGRNQQNNGGQGFEDKVGWVFTVNNLLDKAGTAAQYGFSPGTVKCIFMLHAMLRPVWDEEYQQAANGIVNNLKGAAGIDTTEMELEGAEIGAYMLLAEQMQLMTRKNLLMRKIIRTAIPKLEQAQLVEGEDE